MNEVAFLFGLLQVICPLSCFGWLTTLIGIVLFYPSDRHSLVASWIICVFKSIIFYSKFPIVIYYITLFYEICIVLMVGVCDMWHFPILTTLALIVYWSFSHSQALSELLSIMELTLLHSYIKSFQCLYQSYHNFIDNVNGACVF